MQCLRDQEVDADLAMREAALSYLRKRCHEIVMYFMGM